MIVLSVARVNAERRIKVKAVSSGRPCYLISPAVLAGVKLAVSVRLIFV